MEKQFTVVQPFIIKAPPVPEISGLIKNAPTKRELYGNHKRPYKYHK